MTGRIRGLVILLGALVIVTSLLVFLRMGDRDSDEPQTAESTSIDLMSLETGSVNFAEMETPFSSLTFSLDNEGNWQLENAPGYFRENQDTIRTAIEGFASTRSTTIVLDNAGDEKLEEYGLLNPEAKVTLSDKNGEQTTLEIGRKSPSGSWRYARKAGTQTVVQLQNYIAERAFQNRSDYRDMSLPSVDTGKFAGLTFINRGETVLVEPEAGDNPFITISSGFDIVQPFRGRYPFSKRRMDEFLSTVPLPREAESWRDGISATDTQTGLDSKNADRLTISDTDGNILSLLLGAEAENGTRYAMFTDHQDAVFTVDTQSLGIMEINPFELVDKFVFLASLSEVSAVIVQQGERSWTLRREEFGEDDDTNDDKYYIDDLEVPRELFSDLYQDLVSLSWEGRTDGSPVQAGMPEVRITYVHKNAGVQKAELRFWPYNDIYFMGSAVGKPVDFLVGRYQIDDLVDAVMALAGATL